MSAQAWSGVPNKRVQSDTASRVVSARFWLCDVLRIEADLGKLAARLTRRALGPCTDYERDIRSGKRMEIIVEGPFLGKALVCEPILRALPEWFGIEEATQQYIRDIDGLPTLLARLDGEVVGFLTIKQHTECAGEIHVMGVRQDAQRRGIGRALLVEAEEHLTKRGVEYLQVKTLSPARPNEHYRRTREFYVAMGFRPLEEFPLLWGEANPCLQMVKKLGKLAGA